jgi:hypothetical protein
MFKYNNLLRLAARMENMLFNKEETGNETLVEREDHIEGGADMMKILTVCKIC